MMIAPENLRVQEDVLTGRAISIYQRLSGGEVQVFTGTYGHTTDTALMWSASRPGEPPAGAARTMFAVLLGVVLDQPGTVALGELEVGAVLADGPLDGAVVEGLGDGADVSLSELAVAYLRTPGGGRETLLGEPGARVAVRSAAPVTRATFNDPTHNPPSKTPAGAFPDLPRAGRSALPGFLDRLETLLGHGVDVEWYEHPNPEDGTAGEIEIGVHVLHFARPDERPWLLTLRGQVFTDADLAPEWTWAWDSPTSDEILWESAPELGGWGWPTAAEATDVLTLLTRERAKWDDGLDGL